MGHEPRGSIGTEAEHAPELMGTHAFLAGGHEMRGKQPFVQRDMRPLVEPAHCCCERLLAGAALVEPRTGTLAL